MGSANRNPLRKIWRVIVQTSNIYIEIDGEQRAAAFGYYVLFSLFPLFALLLTVGSSFFGSEAIISTIKSFLPIEDPEQRFIWEAVHKLELARGGVGTLCADFALVFTPLFSRTRARRQPRLAHCRNSLVAGSPEKPPYGRDHR